ncbi:MAG: Rid family detoxifying hydrolase [Acidimicrobiia bacterium]
MDIEAIDNETMPKALGPYSQVIRAGDLLFVSGQAGIDPDTEALPTGGFEAEARQAFLNLRRALTAAGSGPDRVVKTTVFLGAAEFFPTMNALYAETFPTRPPARSTPIVALPRGLRISIDAIAAR